MIKVYLSNRPALAGFDAMDGLSGLQKGDIEKIVKGTGNHWRKVFNVYAKFMFALAVRVESTKIAGFSSWQQYRDALLLQQADETALLFYPHEQHKREHLMSSLTKIETGNLRIIMGKSFSSELFDSSSIHWFDNDFAFDSRADLWVCPYFDYRQLSNLKIERFIGLIIDQYDKDSINKYLSK